MLLSLTVNKTTGYILTLCFFSLLAKLVNIDDLGIILILFQLLVTFTLLLSLGGPFAANILISQNKNLINNFLIQGLKQVLLTSIVVLPIVYFILKKVYFLNFNESLFFCLILFLNTVLFYYSQIFQAIKLTNYAFLFNNYGMKGTILQFFFIIGLLFFSLIKIDYTIINILKIVSCAMIIQLIIVFCLLKGIKKNMIQEIGVLNAKDIVYSGFGIGINRFIKSLIMPLTFTYIVYTYNSEISGIYQSNFRIIITLTTFFSSIYNPTIIPDLNGLFEKNIGDFKNLFLKVITVTFLVNFALMLFYLLFYEDITKLLFNENFILLNNEIIALIIIGIFLNTLNTYSLFLNYSIYAYKDSKLNLFGVLLCIFSLGVFYIYDIVFSIEALLAFIILVPYSLPLIIFLRKD